MGYKYVATHIVKGEEWGGEEKRGEERRKTEERQK